MCCCSFTDHLHGCRRPPQGHAAEDRPGWGVGPCAVVLRAGVHAAPGAGTYRRITQHTSTPTAASGAPRPVGGARLQSPSPAPSCAVRCRLRTVDVAGRHASVVPLIGSYASTLARPGMSPRHMGLSMRRVGRAGQGNGDEDARRSRWTSRFFTLLLARSLSPSRHQPSPAPRIRSEAGLASSVRVYSTVECGGRINRQSVGRWVACGRHATRRGL